MGQVRPPLQEAQDDPKTHSSFKLEITLAIGYQRRRAVLGGAFEGHIVTVGLLIGGILLVLAVVYGLLHLLRFLPF